MEKSKLKIGTRNNWWINGQSELYSRYSVINKKKWEKENIVKNDKTYQHMKYVCHFEPNWQTNGQNIERYALKP